jgi:acyl-ACP thioesterase
MDHLSIWKEKFKITHSFVAPDGLASIRALAYCMQETAVNHAEARNFGYELMIKQNIAWVLTRQVIKLYEIPRLNQKITVETWANGTTKTMAIRDFNILNKEKVSIGIARTSWMILDIIRRRPILLTKEILDNIPTIPNRLSESLELEKIPVSDLHSDDGLEFKVVYSDLDMNHHVNNINYLKWVLDEFDLEFRNRYRVSTIETNYLAEALYGDILVRDTVAVSDTEYLTRIINKDTGKPILASRTNWVAKN